MALSAAVINTIDKNDVIGFIQGNYSLVYGLDDSVAIVNGTKGICGALIFTAILALFKEIAAIIKRVTQKMETKELIAFFTFVGFNYVILWFKNCNRDFVLFLLY